MNIQEAVLADGMLDIRLRALRGTVERSQANTISLLTERDEVSAALASAKVHLLLARATTSAKSLHSLPNVPEPGHAAPVHTSNQEEDWIRLEQMVRHFVSGQQEQDDMVSQSAQGATP